MLNGFVVSSHNIMDCINCFMNIKSALLYSWKKPYFFLILPFYCLLGLICQYFVDDFLLLFMRDIFLWFSFPLMSSVWQQSNMGFIKSLELLSYFLLYRKKFYRIGIMSSIICQSNSPVKAFGYIFFPLSKKFS